MAVTEGFKDLVKDLLADFGPVTIRNMFGGAGIYAGRRHPFSTTTCCI